MPNISSFGDIFSGGGSLFFNNSSSKNYWPTYEHTFGIAIQSFDPPSPLSDYCIRLSVGDLVIIRGEFEGWYKGERFPSTTSILSTVSSNSPQGFKSKASGMKKFLQSSGDSDQHLSILTTNALTGGALTSSNNSSGGVGGGLGSPPASPTAIGMSMESTTNSLSTTHHSRASRKFSENESMEKVIVSSKGFFPATHIIRFDGSPNNPFSLNYQLATGVSEQNQNRNSSHEGSSNNNGSQQQMAVISANNSNVPGNLPLVLLSPRKSNASDMKFGTFPNNDDQGGSCGTFPNNDDQGGSCMSQPTLNSNVLENPPITISSSSNSSLPPVDHSGEISNNSPNEQNDFITTAPVSASPALSSIIGSVTTSNTGVINPQSSLKNNTFSISDNSILGSSPSLEIKKTNTNQGTSSSQTPISANRTKSFRRGVLNSFHATKQKIEHMINKPEGKKNMTPNSEKRQSIINESQKSKRTSLNLSGMNLSNIFSNSRDEFAVNQRAISFSDTFFTDHEKMLSPSAAKSHERKRSQSISANTAFLTSSKNTNAIISTALTAIGNVYPEQIYAQSSYLGGTVEIFPNVAQHFQREIIPFLELDWFAPFLNIPICKTIIETVFDWNMKHFKSLTTHEDNRERLMRVFEIECKMINSMIDYYSYQHRNDSENYKPRMKEILKNQAYLLEEGASLFNEDITIKKNGELLTPMNTLLFDLYQMYWEVIDKEKSQITGSLKLQSSFDRLPEGNFQLLMEISGCSYFDRVEWRFCLYDIGSKSIMSEDLVIVTSRKNEYRVSVTSPENNLDESQDDIIQQEEDDPTEMRRQDIYAVFKDVSKLYLEGEQLVVLVRAYRLEKIKVDPPINHKHTLDCRVPLAIALSPKLSRSVVTELANDGYLRCELNFFNFKSNDSLEMILDDILNDKQDLERDALVGVELSLSMVTGDYHKAFKQYPQLTHLPLVPMTRFSSSILSDDIRNDIYISLHSLLNKSIDTLYVEAKMYIKDKEGHTIQCDINRKQRVYRSPILRMKNPTWDEIILVNVNSHQLQSAIIIFDFYTVNSKKNNYEVTHKFFAYLPIDDATRTLTLGVETYIEPLTCYKISKGYTFQDFMNNESIRTKFAKKSRLTISLNVVSTSIAINPNLRDFLKWDSMDETNIQSVIKDIDFKTVDTAICFREIVSSLFGIANKYGKARNNIDFVESQLLQKVFEKICTIVSTLSEDSERFNSVIDDYSKSFPYHTSHRFILHYLSKYFDLFKAEDMTIGTKEKLVRALVSFVFFVKIIEKSLSSFKTKLPDLYQEELTFVQNEITIIYSKLNLLAQKSDATHSTFKNIKSAFFDSLNPSYYDTLLSLFDEVTISRQIESFMISLPEEEVHRKLAHIDIVVSSNVFEMRAVNSYLLPKFVDILENFGECFLENKSISIMNKLIQYLKKQLSPNKPKLTPGMTKSCSTDSLEERRGLVLSIEDAEGLAIDENDVCTYCVSCLKELLGLVGLLKEAFETSLERTEELEAEYAAARERIEQEGTLSINNSQNVNQSSRQTASNVMSKYESDINQSKRVSCDVVITIVNFLDVLTYKDVLDCLLSMLSEYSSCAELDTIELILDLISMLLSKKNPLPKNWTQMNIYQYGTISTIILMNAMKVKKYMVLLEGPSITSVSTFSGNFSREAIILNKPIVDVNVNRITKVSQLLIKYLFDTVFSFEPEKMRTFDRNQFLSQNDQRAKILTVFYEDIWSFCPLQLQESCLLELIDKSIRLFKINISEVIEVAKNLFFDLLKIEYESRHSVSLCEAGSERFFSEVTGLEGVRHKFINCIESKLHKYKRLSQELSSSIDEQANDQFPVHVEQLLNSLHHLLSQIREIEAASTNDPNTMNFQSQEKSFKNALKSFKKNNNMQLYFKYLHLLASMQKSRKRYIEAGLAIYVHASKLDINSQNELPYFSDFYPEEVESKRKIKLYMEIIDLFEKGKDWERAIKLHEELREHYKKNMNYLELSTIHLEEGKLYKKIVSSIREYNKYYFVGFYGKALSNTNYIFNAHHQKLADFVNFIKMKFKGAVIKREIPTSFDETKFRTSEQQVIFLAPLEPSCMNEMESYSSEKHFEKSCFQLLDSKVSPKIQQYHKSHNVNVFKRIKVKREEKKEDNHHATTESSLTSTTLQQPSEAKTCTINLEDADGIISFFTIKHPFPNMYTIQEVLEKKVIKLNTLEVAIYYIEQKIHFLQELVISHKLNESNLLTASLDSELTGLIDPRIHGGIYVEVEKYLSPSALETLYEENKYLVAIYKQRLSQLAYLLKEGLVQRRKHVSKQNLQMSVYLEKKFKNDLIPLLERYNIRIP
ncbi:hypothetical protein FDP41_011714 [Naegleria fowleri]|uniref:DOCKER domain-containing protein n=1 Tax=Naegleria fowleri TaxID=5763 RepID=A0A6A5BUU7_NAEFO|nr:uncharacterized protein FDP41_011714 [Naegleria fowleri]KAF0981853.1 hypothetical protein FDP41_011714 [Naegleria fowleri]